MFTKFRCLILILAFVSGPGFAKAVEVKRGDTVLSRYYPSLPEKAVVLDVANGRVMTSNSMSVYLELDKIELYRPESKISTHPLLGESSTIKVGDTVLSRFYRSLPERAIVNDIANGRVQTSNSLGVYLELDRIELYRPESEEIDSSFSRRIAHNQRR